MNVITVVCYKVVFSSRCFKCAFFLICCYCMYEQLQFYIIEMFIVGCFNILAFTSLEFYVHTLLRCYGSITIRPTRCNVVMVSVVLHMVTSSGCYGYLVYVTKMLCHQVAMGQWHYLITSSGCCGFTSVTHCCVIRLLWFQALHLVMSSSCYGLLVLLGYVTQMLWFH